MKRRATFGFTLLEVLVSLSIIGILTSILYVSFDSGRENARDAERQSELKKLALATELYRSQNGRYPQQGCGGATSWTGPGPHSASWANSVSCDQYIVGLVPNYIDKLPTDPRFETVDNRGFFYRTNAEGSVYKAMNHLGVEARTITGYDQEFARCPYNCGSAICGSSLAAGQHHVYAVYSNGAECW